MGTCTACGCRDVSYSSVCAFCSKELDDEGVKQRFNEYVRKEGRFGIVLNFILFSVFGYLPCLLLILWLPDLHANYLLDAMFWTAIFSIGLTVLLSREIAKQSLRAQDQMILAPIEEIQKEEEEERKGQEESREAERRRQVFKDIEHVTLFGATAIGIRNGSFVMVSPALKVTEIHPDDIIDVELDEYQVRDGYVERPKVKQLNGPEGAYATATARAIQDSTPPTPIYKKQYQLKLTVSDLSRPVLYFDGKGNKLGVDRWVGRIRALKHQAQQPTVDGKQPHSP